MIETFIIHRYVTCWKNPNVTVDVDKHGPCSLMYHQQDEEELFTRGAEDSCIAEQQKHSSAIWKKASLVLSSSYFY